MNYINDSSRETFKKELDKRGGFFFKIYGNSFLRIGAKEKYFIEGTYKQLDTVQTKSLLTKTKYSIYIVNIKEISYFEGIIKFDAIPSNIDSKPSEKICFFLPNAVKDEKGYYLIKNHEINHIRVEELLKNKIGELNSFFSELLADVLLISELKDTNLLSYKLRDINSLLENSNTPIYYNKYLIIIREILKKQESRSIANKILDAATNFKFNQTSIEKLEEEIFKIL